MYVYYFRTNRGRSNDVFISKVIGKPKDITLKFKPFLSVELDPEGGINKKWIVISPEEGKIYKRVFWLEDYDLDKADQIIDDYNKEKFIKLQKQIETL